MPKTTYLARVSVLSAEEEGGRRVFITGIIGLFGTE
jgi:hypothetical protein